MGIFFTADELLDIAVGIEKNGQAFYRLMAERTRTESARSVFQFLAGEEKHHEAVFERMRKAGMRITPPESYEGEYMTYMKSLVDSLVFHKPGDIQAIKTPDSEIDAIATGIQAEKDSLIFYNEMLNLSTGNDRAMLEDIIREEKSHLRQLSEMKTHLEMSRGR